MCPSGDRDYLDSVLFQLRVNIRPRGQALGREGPRVKEQQQPPVASGCGPNPAAESGHRSLQPAQRHSIYFVTSPLGHHCEGGHHRSGAPGNSRNKYRGLRGHGQADAFPDHADRRVQGFQPPSARLVKHKTVQRRAFTACAHRIWARRLRSLAHDFAPSVISWGVSRLPYPG
jgi:hypothetical protein